MYLAPNRAAAAAGAGQQYRSIDVTSKVEGASPHKLVSILYEELILATATMKQAVRRGDVARRNDAGTRAVALLQSLDQSLDFEKGGEIAKALTAVYAEARRLLGLGRTGNDADAIGRAQGMLGEIAAAWNAIG